jgi:phosphoadenosine phosphosulfate reductase
MFLELQSYIPGLEDEVKRLSIDEVLQNVSARFPDRITFSTSFSMEDQVILHKILINHLPIRVFTLDTGRLFPETYSVWSATNEKYKVHIHAYYPNALMLEDYVSKKGPNAFYESVENRKGCCYIRKVEPLKRALRDNSVWITGLRAEHSANRNQMPSVEWDEGNGIIKYHPLLHWTTEEVKQYIDDNNIPYNPMHDRGFVSIGCAPCTRAIRPGEDFRSGRWWWEDNNKKECGLHVHESNLKTIK